eukprot:365570-Pleurochrysis_carterae.AAC.2
MAAVSSGVDAESAHDVGETLSADVLQKKLRAVQKKLRRAESLQAMMHEGKPLDTQGMAKVNSIWALRDEMAELAEALALAEAPNAEASACGDAVGSDEARPTPGTAAVPASMPATGVAESGGPTALSSVAAQAAARAACPERLGVQPDCSAAAACSVQAPQATAPQATVPQATARPADADAAAAVAGGRGGRGGRGVAVAACSACGV